MTTQPEPTPDRAVTDYDDELLTAFALLVIHARDAIPGAIPEMRECRAEILQRMRLVATERPAADTVRIGLEDAINFDGALTHGWKPDAKMMTRLRTAIDVALRTDTVAVSASAGADPYPDHARMDAYAHGYNDASRDAALAAKEELES